MKSRKIEKKYEYTGLGFPVYLYRVPMIDVRGVWTPDIVLTTEREIRMTILDHILKKAEDFRKAYRVIHELDFRAEPEPVEIDTQTDLIAI